jgi:exopolysaccharide biosynthesis polyprenyl glycosylphosphotransferase
VLKPVRASFGSLLKPRNGRGTAPIPEGRTSQRIYRREALYRRSLAIADVVSATFAAWLALEVLGDDALAALALLALPLIVVMNKAVGLYDRDPLLIRRTTLDEAPKLFQLTTLYTLIFWLAEDLLLRGDVDLLGHRLPPSAPEIGHDQALGFWAILFGLMLVGRSLARRIARLMSEEERCLVIGNEDAAQRVAATLHQGRGLKATLLGRVPLESEEWDPPVHGLPVLGSISTLPVLVEEHDVDRVIVVPSSSETERVLDAVRLVKSLGIKISVIPRLFEVVGSSVEFEDLDGIPILGVRDQGLTRSSLVLKRGFDLVGASLGLLLLSPVLALIAVSIKASSSGPVLFRQPRIGRKGELFDMLKFRTMVDGADELKEELWPRNEAGEGLFKISDDPRLTRVGQLLRPLSLDELPQLWNVLLGHMSLVGPRPLVPDEDSRIEGWRRVRLHLPPGMTGFWQILGSSRIPVEQMVKLDYFYGANWSLWLDVKILIKTVPYLLSRQGQ